MKASGGGMGKLVVLGSFLKNSGALFARSAAASAPRKAMHPTKEPSPGVNVPPSVGSSSTPHNNPCATPSTRYTFPALGPRVRRIFCPLRRPKSGVTISSTTSMSTLCPLRRLGKANRWPVESRRAASVKPGTGSPSAAASAKSAADGTRRFSVDASICSRSRRSRCPFCLDHEMSRSSSSICGLRAASHERTASSVVSPHDLTNKAHRSATAHTAPPTVFR
jgi:hypothetical protein